MTQTLSGLSGAFYLDDPKADSIEFNRVELKPRDAYQYQAPWGSRYWDQDAELRVETLKNGSEAWISVQPDDIKWIQGKVVFKQPLKKEDRVRATGKMRDENHFKKLFNLYNGVLAWDMKAIDITSSESEGWDEFMPGTGSFSFNADTYFYFDPTAGEDMEIRRDHRLLANIYSWPKKAAWVGFGQIVGSDLNLVNANRAQTRRISFKGSGELYPEMGE